MFTVRVRDHFMIAHSFSGELFGPAQKLHGATYVVDVEFRREELNEDNVVVDIGRATEQLGAILAEMNYRNLDEVEAFAGQNTTTEFLARHIHSCMADAIRAGSLGPGGEALHSLKVELGESHVAWAGYEATLRE
ncbi:MAG: 6-carboxytetrahydropterin synthase [Geminicoccaceae bacterium]|nr:6-carboxytetrahydropterin synthase [Geminicoccaceae bacterium]